VAYSPKNLKNCCFQYQVLRKFYPRIRRRIDIRNGGIEGAPGNVGICLHQYIHLPSRFSPGLKINELPKLYLSCGHCQYFVV
jgi:hypothetical protein